MKVNLGLYTLSSSLSFRARQNMAYLIPSLPLGSASAFSWSQTTYIAMYSSMVVGFASRIPSASQYSTASSQFFETSPWPTYLSVSKSSIVKHWSMLLTDNVPSGHRWWQVFEETSKYSRFPHWHKASPSLFLQIPSPQSTSSQGPKNYFKPLKFFQKTNFQNKKLQKPRFIYGAFEKSELLYR